MITRELKTWAKNKNTFAVYVAFNLAVLARLLPSVLEQIQQFKCINEGWNSQDYDRWINFYKKPSRFNKITKRFVVKKITQIIPLKFIRKILIKFILADSLSSKKNVVDYLLIKQTKTLTLFQLILKRWLSKRIEDTMKDLAIQDISSETVQIKNPRKIFLLRVWLPCVIEYQTLPSLLYRKARQGDYESIYKIARLDLNILEDKRIRRNVLSLKPTLGNKLLNAGNQIPKTNLKPIKIKSNISGLISAVSLKFGKKLRANDIRKLFDILAQKLDGTEIDTDIQEGEDAFRKAVDKHRKLWLSITDGTIKLS